MSGGVGPAELEPVAPVGADHMLSGEDETGPERGEEAGGGVLWHLCVGSLRLGCFRRRVHMRPWDQETPGSHRQSQGGDWKLF